MSLIVVLAATMFIPGDSRETVDYADFIGRAEEGAVVEAEYDNTDGGITFTDTSGTEFSTVGPLPLPDDDNASSARRPTNGSSSPRGPTSSPR